MKVGRWSTTPGNNNSTPPDGWPEGQAPSTVNDCAREMMASIRAMVNDLQYVDQDMTPTYISATTFSVPGNQTSAIHSGRRLKLFDATAGLGVVIYGTVATASFTAVTTITVEPDSGALTSSLSSFAIAILSNTNNAIPRDLTLTVSSVAVSGSMSISGAAVLGGTTTFRGQLFQNQSAAVAIQGRLCPVGAIVMWSGSTAAIPEGWQLCNGTNGTPDLRNRFIVGAGSTYAVAATGGTADAVNVAHTHTGSGSTDAVGDHAHAAQFQAATGSGYPGFTGSGDAWGIANTGGAGAHSHNVTVTVASSGVSGTNQNLPPYYALAYIMCIATP